VWVNPLKFCVKVKSGRFDEHLSGSCCNGEGKAVLVLSLEMIALQSQLTRLETAQLHSIA
jgi:hypothetical protein